MGKHTPYFELVDAQSMAGCPICRLVFKATDRYLDGILWEAVLDSDVRAKLKASQGFCGEHVDMLRRTPGRALGIALIYRDIIRVLAKKTDAALFQGDRSPWRRLLGKAHHSEQVVADLSATVPCPACKIGEQAADNYIDLLLAYVDDPQLAEAYAQGEGLCLPHFLQAIERAESQKMLEHLIGPQVARYRRMLDDLDEFIRKRDHRFRHEKYGEEGDVWLRTMNTIVGGAGLGLSAATGGRREADLWGENR
jgi:hypothetical protein